MVKRKQSPSFIAISPHIDLFNAVKLEFDDDSTINQGEKFNRYYLDNRWGFINMAQDCIGNSKMLRKCNIRPLRTIDNGIVGAPLWFRFDHIRQDGHRHTQSEICTNFWKKFRTLGSSLYMMYKTFDEITDIINYIVKTEKKHMNPVVVSKGDVIISCRRIFPSERTKDKDGNLVKNGKRDGWYGHLCVEEFLHGEFRPSPVTISRPLLPGKKARNI